MDVLLYKRLKATGLAELVKINDSYAVVWHEYQPDGTLINREEAVGREIVEAEIAQSGAQDARKLKPKGQKP